MAYFDALGLTSSSSLALGLVVATTLAIGLYSLFQKPAFIKGTPPFAFSEHYPVLGALRFFNARWDFMKNAGAHSPTGNFSFYAGKYPVIGLSGAKARKIFFESKQLSMAEGYAVMLGQQPPPPGKADDGPTIKVDEGASSFTAYFNRRLTRMLRRETLERNLHRMLADTRSFLDVIAKSPSGVTDPFDSIYRIIFHITMLTVGCNEITDDKDLMDRSLKLFETIERSASSTNMVLPWLPTPSKLRRTVAGTQLYMIFTNIARERKKTGRREEDGLQFLLDQGDTITDIIGFVVGALFAGLLNSGINAAAVLVYLAKYPKWLAKAREEVENVVRKYSTDKEASLADQLFSLPLDAWESEFVFLDYCLKDSIRLQLAGAAFRQNISDQNVEIGSEIIPPGAFVALHVNDIHRDPETYSNPDQWDPSRYMPERAEDKKKPYGWAGWGLGRHPCLGMRLAKLEQSIIVALFLLTFDFTLSDAAGNKVDTLPEWNLNNATAAKPETKAYLKCQVREKQGTAAGGMQ